MRPNFCKFEKKGGGVMLFVPLKFAPMERKDLNFSDKIKFDSIWVECRNDFSKNCKKTMLNNVTYYPMKQFQN